MLLACLTAVKKKRKHMCPLPVADIIAVNVDYYQHDMVVGCVMLSLSLSLALSLSLSLSRARSLAHPLLSLIPTESALVFRVALVKTLSLRSRLELSAGSSCS